MHNPVSKLTEKQIKKFIERSKNVARSKGYPEFADDFSQEVILTFIRKPESKPTIDQLFIDYLRRTYGRKGTLGGDARINARFNTISIDAYAVDEAIQEVQLPSYDSWRCTRDDSRFDELDWRIEFLFRGKKAEIYRLYFIEEFTESKIAEIFNVTESRISQILGSIKKEIQDYYILKEMKERMEWGDRVGVFQVDWIQI